MRRSVPLLRIQDKVEAALRNAGNFHEARSKLTDLRGNPNGVIIRHRLAHRHIRTLLRLHRRSSYQDVRGRTGAQAEIGDGHIAGVKRNGSGARKVAGVRKEGDAIDDVEALVVFDQRLKPDFVPILIYLLHAMADAVLRVPGLGRDANKIRSGIQMAEVVVTFVVGVRAPHLERPASPSGNELVEEHYVGMTNGIVRFIEYVSGNGSAGPQAENQIFRVESRANDDGSHEILMLLIHLREVQIG